ncbi:sugar ABC transporter ATP-binding protein [Cryptosporangium arvum]|uniref:Monosaccharide ABC transporter ATP-binding protein, CUT2 family n=1 Tax=Cryptosporangium arvum DSM 44712 TaxID=927661 RepID=A0A010ZRH6_9ACTN|nr:sugar ABC transporter ATP-binding protein [Cryptosporangium arvum]EXG79787.1 monosaccharide ABC transporter ATP-binding protein, CUT2 family [Cryptosporangium arvum DSM 44712]
MSSPVSTPHTGTTTVSVRGVGKSFGPNVVLRGVDLEIVGGEVVALLGANGAGKSTLIKILAGAHPDHTGEILVDGEPVRLASPTEARARGIATVHQRVREGVVPGLTVAENLAFDELAGGGASWALRRREVLEVARRAVEVLDLGWSDAVLRRDVATLGISDAQLLVVARTLLQRPKLLILDEPTSALSSAESDRLFGVVRQLRADGLAVLLVSHRLGEVDAIADRAVVLRDGRVTADVAKPLSWPVILPAMLGDSAEGLRATVLDHDRPTTDDAASSSTTSVVRLSGVRLFAESPELDLSLNGGEVTGIVGLIGAGKSELAHGLFGSARWPAGTADFADLARAPRSPAEAIRSGVYLVPEDRADQALLPGWSIQRTLSLPFITKVASRVGVLNQGTERDRATTVIEKLGIVARGPRTELNELSGGNQQKVVVGRWLVENARLLLLDEPFRGVDLGARRDIGEQVRAVANAGGAVVVLSADVDEVLEVADRVLVLVEGALTLDSPLSQVSRDDVVRAFSGEVAQ